jgi:hypothetical protein
MQRFSFGLIALTGCLALSAYAGDPPQIRSVKGSVSIRTEPQGQQVSTETGAQADVVLDAVHSFRVEPETEIHVAVPQEDQYEVRLVKGSITYRVAGPSVAQVSVDTPSVSIRPSERGVYSIAVDDQVQTVIVPKSGAIEVFAPAGSQWVAAGQKMIVRGPASDPEFQIVRVVSKLQRALAIVGQVVSTVQVAGLISGGGSGSGGGGVAQARAASALAAHNSGSAPPRSAPPHPAPAPRPAPEAPHPHK